MAQLADRITANPKQCGGRPCIRGMRIRVTDILDMLGSSPELCVESRTLHSTNGQAALAASFRSRRERSR